MEGKGMGDIVSSGVSTALNFAGPMVEGFGAGMSGAAAYNKSVADKAAFEMQASVAENNSELARFQASDAIRRGQSTQAISQLKTRQLQGAQAAAMAANGVDLATGSALNILSDTEFMGENDATVIALNAAKEAWGYNIQSTNAGNNAKLLHYRAAMEDPDQAERTSLLTSASSVAKRWYGVRHNLAGEQ